jgi:hypothetical protein
MSYENCIEVIRKAAGDISLNEIEEIVTELQKRQKRIQLAESLTDVGEAAMRAADSIAKDLEMAAIIEKRNAAINAKVRIVATSFVQKNFSTDYVEGVRALLNGTNILGIANRDSVDARQIERRSRYAGRLEADLDKAGVSELFASGTIDRDIARALWAVDGGKFDGPDEAMTIAKIINKHQESWRQDLNKHGAWIGKIENYIVRQSHDPMKMMRGGFEAWKDEISTKLDWGKIMAEMPDKNPDEFLKQVYKNLVSGNHQKAPADVTAFKGPGNLAKRLSQDRVLHFKDADAWFDYNEKYGMDSIRESVANSLDSAAQAVGIFQKLGTNPASMIKTIIDDLQRSGDPIQGKKLNEARKVIDNALASVDGRMRIPVNETLARRGSFWRVWTNMSKLGGGIFAQFVDPAVMATEIRYQGGNLFEGIVGALTGMAKRVGGTSAEKREFYQMVGKTSDLFLQNIAARFSGDDTLGGRMARLQNTFFKWNLMRPFTGINEETAVGMMAHNLARNADKSFENLGNLRRVLELSGIDSQKWDAIRQSAQRAADGDMYISPEAMRELPDSVIDPLIKGKVTNYSREAMRDELETLVRSYLLDRSSFAVLRPDAKTRAIALQGTLPGTPEGEVIRMLMQFKSYPISFIQKILGREVYGQEGAERVSGIFQVMAITTIFGYMAMAAKDLAKGKEPRELLDPETGLNWKTVGAAMQQGGGFGIYGDFLFGEMRNRAGQGFLATAAGPTFGEVDRLADIWGRLKAEDDAGAASFNLLMSNVPFANHFMLRPAADYLFLRSITEAINPGALRRMEEKTTREKEQEWLIRPSETYLDPIGAVR